MSLLLVILYIIILRKGKKIDNYSSIKGALKINMAESISLVVFKFNLKCPRAKNYFKTVKVTFNFLTTKIIDMRNRENIISRSNLAILKQATICPGSSEPFYIVTYCINWITTSWTYSIFASTSKTWTLTKNLK